MRDEIDGRIWDAHHDRFSDLVDGALAAARQAIVRAASWDGTTHHLVALVASFALTALTFNATTS